MNTEDNLTSAMKTVLRKIQEKVDQEGLYTEDIIELEMFISDIQETIDEWYQELAEAAGIDAIF